MDTKKWYDQLTSNQKAAYQRGVQGVSGNKSEADGLINSNQLANNLKTSLNNYAAAREIEEFSDFEEAQNM